VVNTAVEITDARKALRVLGIEFVTLKLFSWPFVPAMERTVVLVGAMGEETNAEAFHAIPTQMMIDFVILHCIILGSMY